MHGAFLIDRTMKVKIGTHLSNPRNVTGGAVHGSVLGVLDHNAVLESLDDDLLDIYVAKYIDDITVVEAVPKDIDFTYSDLEEHIFHPQQSQVALTP